MSQAGSGDWVSRLSESLKSHESTRRRVREVLPRYEIQGELGRGGMGVVYRAWDPQLNRAVALKVLPEEAGDNAEARERFLREAQLAAQVAHPNIIPIYDAGEHEGRIYLAMQLIEGRTLDRAGLEPRKAVEAVRDAARAVHHAHVHGIVHRDLKPSNLMIDKEGRVYVADFGLARRTDAGATLTISGQIVGTPAYMPPEQARGKAADARSDVYSLGATLYEALAGRPPFGGDNAMEVMKAVLLDEPVFPSRHNASVPKDVEAVILKAMSKAASARYATAEAMAEDLDRCLKGEGVAAPMRGTLYRLRKKIVRHRWRVMAWSALGGAALLAGVLAWVIVRGHWQERIQTAVKALNDALEGEDVVRIDRAFKALQQLAPEKADSMRALVSLTTKFIEYRRAFEKSLKEKRWPEAEEVLQSVRDLHGLAPAKVDTLALMLEDARTAEAVTAFKAALKKLDWSAAESWVDRLAPINPEKSLELASDLKKERDRIAQLTEIDQIFQLMQVFSACITADREEEVATARTLLLELDRLDPANAANRLLQVRKAEFRVWIAGLDRLVGPAFSNRYEQLSSSEYRIFDQSGQLARLAYRMGLRQCDQGNPKEAVLWLDRAFALGLPDPALFRHRGIQLIILREWDRAEKDYQDLLKHIGPSERPPEFSRLFLFRGKEALDAGRAEKAFEHLNLAVELNRNNAQAHHLLGLARLLIKGSEETALKDLVTALESDPLLKPDAIFIPTLVRHIGKLVADHWKEEDAAQRQLIWRKADALLSLLIERAQAPPELLAERARVRRRLGRSDDALKDAEAIGDTPAGNLLRGQLDYVRANGRFGDPALLASALAHLERARKADEANASIRYWRGRCLHALGRNTEAVEDLVSAVRADPPRMDSHLVLSLIHLAERKFEDVIRSASEGLQAPLTLREEEFVGTLYERAGHSFPKALQLEERDLRHMRAQAYYESKDFAASIADSTRTTELDPDFAAGYLYLGYARCRSGRHLEASGDFQRVLEKSQDQKMKESARVWKEQCDQDGKR